MLIIRAVLVTCFLMSAPVYAQPLMGPEAVKNPKVEVALSYIETVWVQHDPVLGFKKYVDEKSIHFPGEPGGSNPHGLAAFLKKFPDFKYDVKQVFADGNFVIVHSFLTGVPGTGSMVQPAQPGAMAAPKVGDEVVDIYEIKNGKIVRHWDIIEAIGGTVDGLF